MQFNGETNNLDICSEIDSLCDTDSTSYPTKHKTRRVNAALEQVIGWLINADGTWQFDDSNYTDLPRGSVALVADQNKYTFNDRFLHFEAAEVRNAAGDMYFLQPIDQFESYGDIPLEEAFPTSGLPIYYDKISDDSINIYPAPSATDVTLSKIVSEKETGGLRITFKRTAHLFTVDDTTAVPGFASPYHVILAYMAAIPYCMTYKKDRVALYEQKIAQLKDELIKHYSRREKDVRKMMTMKPISFR